MRYLGDAEMLEEKAVHRYLFIVIVLFFKSAFLNHNICYLYTI